MLFCNLSPAPESAHKRIARVLGMQELWRDRPQLHVLLDVKQVLESNSPGLSRCRLKHEPPKLGVKGRRRSSSSGTKLVNTLSAERVEALLWLPLGQVWHAAPLSKQFWITCQGFQYISLSERQFHILLCIIERNDKVFDLRLIELRSNLS